MQDGGYDDGGCETELQCSLCNFQQYPRATLRGICKNDWTDIFYTIVFDEVTNMPYFKGFSGTIIKYDEDNQGRLKKIGKHFESTTDPSLKEKIPLTFLSFFFFETFPQQWLMSHSSGVNGSAVASIQPMGTGALMWTINKDICNRNTLQPFDALMTVCTVSF